MRGVVPVDRLEEMIDTDSAYTVASYRGVAWHIVGHPEIWPESEEGWPAEEPEPDLEHVCAVMIGDDRVFVFEPDELTAIPADAYCSECGQIGCGGDSRDTVWQTSTEHDALQGVIPLDGDVTQGALL